WSVPFRGATPQALPDLVKSDIGAIASIGLTRDGALYYKLQPGSANIFVAGFDLASGQLSSTPIQPIRQFKGFNGSPEWSRDGKLLGYTSYRDVPAPINVTRPVLAILSMESGQTREVQPATLYLGGKWSADGRTVLARGADLKGRSGAVKVDTTT